VAQPPKYTVPELVEGNINHKEGKNMPADMNDYFKKKKPSNNSNNSGGGSNFENPLGNMGKGAPWIQSEPLPAGLHFYIPMFQKIIPVNTRIRLITYSNVTTAALGETYRGFEGGLRRNPAISVLDKRGLTVNIDLAVQYRLKAESAPATIEKWGSGWEEKIINSKVREVVRDVVGQYTAEQLPEMCSSYRNKSKREC
jgi:hypothetical protein